MKPAKSTSHLCDLIQIIPRGHDHQILSSLIFSFCKIVRRFTERIWIRRQLFPYDSDGVWSVQDCPMAASSAR